MHEFTRTLGPLFIIKSFTMSTKRLLYLCLRYAYGPLLIERSTIMVP